MNFHSTLFQAARLLACFVLAFAFPALRAATYYVANGGDNSNNGTSPSTPLADFARFNNQSLGNRITLGNGDTVLLARGSSWTLANTNYRVTGKVIFNLAAAAPGARTSAITIDAYGSGALPLFDLNAADNFNVRGINIVGLSRIVIRNVAFKNQFTANDTLRDGLPDNWGNQCIATVSSVRNMVELTLENIELDNAMLDLRYGKTPDQHLLPTHWRFKTIRINNVQRVGTGGAVIRLQSDTRGGDFGEESITWALQDVVITGCRLGNGPGYGLFIQGATNVRVVDTFVDLVGTNLRPAGLCGVYLHSVNNVKLQNCMITDTDPALVSTSQPDRGGVHLDAFCNAVEIRGSFLADNAGPGVEFTNNFDYVNDYLTGLVVSGCAFLNNGYDGTILTSPARSYTAALYHEPVTNQSELGVADTVNGEVEDNLYQHSFGSDDDKGWRTPSLASALTISGNNKVGSSADLYNVGDRFSGTEGGTDSLWYQCVDGGVGLAKSYDSASGTWNFTVSGSTVAWLNRFNMMPSASSTAWVGKVWGPSKNGTVEIRGYVLKNTLGGDGVKVRIRKISRYPTYSATTIWAETVVGASEVSGLATFVSGVSVSVTSQDEIRFEVNCGTAGNNTADVVSWLPTVAYQ